MPLPVVLLWPAAAGAAAVAGAGPAVGGGSAGGGDRPPGGTWPEPPPGDQDKAASSGHGRRWLLVAVVILAAAAATGAAAVLALTHDKTPSAPSEQPASPGHVHADDREVGGRGRRRLDLDVQGRWTANAVPVPLSVTLAVPESVSIADLADPDTDAFIAYNRPDHGASAYGSRLPIDGPRPPHPAGRLIDVPKGGQERTYPYIHAAVGQPRLHFTTDRRCRHSGELRNRVVPPRRHP